MIGLGYSAPNAAFREVEKCFHDAPSASPAFATAELRCASLRFEIKNICCL